MFICQVHNKTCGIFKPSFMHAYTGTNLELIQGAFGEKSLQLSFKKSLIWREKEYCDVYT